MTKPDPTEAYAGFDGHIGRTSTGSQPDWPHRPQAPKDAPNIIVMLCDDLGFADLGCYGSEIETPHLDRLAQEGLRYTNFHVNPMCSPTRASLLTGLNHHMAGVATVCHRDPGFPGFSMELRANAITMAEALGDAGWATLMVGKWHLSKDSNLSEAGPRHSWPSQRGFDRFYGILDGFTNFHHPHRIYQDNHPVPTDQYPDGYYFTDDLTDQALNMVHQVRAGHPTKPWFLYFAHAAPHTPLQVKPADGEKYRGRFDEGWDEIRRQRFARQLEMGVIPAGTQLPPRNTEENHVVEAWGDLTDQQQELFARYQELYAAMVDNIDQNFGRLRQKLEAIGEWDNTVVVFLSDNGGSREGNENGTSSYFRTMSGRTDGGSPFESLDDDYGRLEKMGGPQTLPHYPMGWAMASGTPFRLYKINTHQGGHQVPFIISRGTGLADGGRMRTQYQHVTDLLPTIFDLAGLPVPAERRGQNAPQPAGSSFAESINNPDAPSTHPEQYYEQAGHRGYYRDGWSAVTCHQPRTAFSEETWELHHLAQDPTESQDVSAQHPEKLAELQQAWEQAAWDNQVFPLDEGTGLLAAQRPPWETALAEPAIFWPATPTVERYRASQLINSRSFTVEVAFDYCPGDQGVLVAHGDQGGGYILYVENDCLHLAYNGYGVMTALDGGPLAIGETTCTLAMEAPGAKLWNATLLINKQQTAQVAGLPMLSSMAPFEGINIGTDRRSPVSWDLNQRHGTFPWTGTLHAVTYTPGELAPDAAARWIDTMREAGTRFD